MRGATSILIILVVTILVVGLYQFLAKPRLDTRIAALEATKTELEQQQMALARMQTEIPNLKAQLPEWRQRLSLYRKAIPAQLEDEVFLTNLQEQIGKHGVELQNIDLNNSGVWLRDLDEKSKEQLTAMGVDVDAAQQIKVAFYTLVLGGDYDKVLSTLEELKRYGRIYSIEQVIAPAGGAGGAVLMFDNPEQVPLQVSGSIFYGIPENYMDSDTLYKNFMRSLISPLANLAQSSIRGQARELVGGSASDAANTPDGTEDENNQAGGTTT